MNKKIWAIFRGNNLIYLTPKGETDAEKFRQSQIDKRELILAYKREDTPEGVWIFDRIFKKEINNYILIKQTR